MHMGKLLAHRRGQLAGKGRMIINRWLVKAGSGPWEVQGYNLERFNKQRRPERISSNALGGPQSFPTFNSNPFAPTKTRLHTPSMSDNGRHILRTFIPLFGAAHLSGAPLR